MKLKLNEKKTNNSTKLPAKLKPSHITLEETPAHFETWRVFFYLIFYLIYIIHVSIHVRQQITARIAYP